MRKTQDLSEEECLLPKPEYTEKELEEIANLLKNIKEEKACKIYALLIAFNYNTYLFQDWCEAANEEYNYNGLFFTSLDNIPLVIEDMTKLDPIEDIVVQWRLSHNK